MKYYKLYIYYLKKIINDFFDNVNFYQNILEKKSVLKYVSRLS